MKTFTELGLSREFVSLLERDKITIPSEIQEKTIPLVLAGKDIIGGSATGSGKTLAFASGIVENLEKNGKVQALILTPTRELAEQVAGAIAKFSKHKRLKVLPIYGGVDIRNQMRLLKNADVVVGTPGRILDHLNRKTLNLSEVNFIVLDEGDRMLDMGFQVDVEKILNKCPIKRQTILFSATISLGVDHLTKKYTTQAVEISVEAHVDASKLKQIYYDVPDGSKFSLFVHLLKQEKIKLIMVFCATRRNVDFVTNNLNNFDINAKAIHGGMNQSKRNKVLHEFNSEGGVNVLVCTDVAARGLDIKEVSHVYNYDLPKISGDYIHRIGRTARAGKDGIAVNVLCSRDYENFSNILRDKKLKIEEVKVPQFERVRIIVDSPNRSSGSGSSRGRGFGREQNNRHRTNSNRRNQGRKDNEKSKGHNRLSTQRGDNKRRNFGGGSGRGKGYNRSGTNRGDNNKRSFRGPSRNARQSNGRSSSQRYNGRR